MYFMWLIIFPVSFSVDIYLFFKMILFPQFGNFPKTSNEIFTGTEVNLQINLEITDNFTALSRLINDCYFSYFRSSFISFNNNLSFFSIKVLHVLLDLFLGISKFIALWITFLLHFLIGYYICIEIVWIFLSWPLSAFLGSFINSIYFSGYLHGKEFLEDFAGGPLAKTLSQCRGSRFDPWWGN